MAAATPAGVAAAAVVAWANEVLTAHPERAAIVATLEMQQGLSALEDAVPAGAIAGTRYAAPQMQHLDSER